MIKTCPNCKVNTYELVFEYNHPDGTIQKTWKCSNCLLENIDWDIMIY